MARGREITCIGFFTYPDGHTVPWDSLSYEEKLEINKTWIKRWEKVIPEIYRDRPEDLAALEDATPEEAERYYQLFPEKRKNRHIAVAET